MNIKKHFSKTLVYAVTVLSILIVIFPIVFLVSNSFMSQKEVETRYTEEITPHNFFDLKNDNLHYVDIGILPYMVTLSGYKEFLFRTPLYLRLFWNSIAIVIPIVLGQCIISPLGAFAFEQMKWKGKEFLYFTYIIIMLLPMQVLLVPHFLVSGWLGLKDTWWAIILPAMFRPFGVFICRQQLKSFPKECLEAARIDGASEFQTFKKIVLPNLKSTLSALVVLTFAQYWNIVDEAVVFIKSPFNEPLSIYLSKVAQGDVGMFLLYQLFTLFLLL